MAPAATPPAAITRANAVFAAALARPDLRKALVEGEGNEIVGGSPEDFGRFLRAEAEKWGEVIRAGGISPD